MRVAARHPGDSRPVETCDAAIIGMACIFPGAGDLETYWHNIVGGVDAVTDVPPGRWDPDVFFDAQATSVDRIYCKRARSPR